MNIKGNDHTFKHSIRVCFLVSYLSECLNISEEDRLKLQIAALFHDIGRRNNQNDANHGQYSIDLAFKKGFFLNNDVINIILYHCKSDKKAKSLSENNKKLLWIFKDADALDRVRTNDLDINQLRFTESKQFISLAKTLLDIKNEI